MYGDLGYLFAWEEVFVQDDIPPWVFLRNFAFDAERVYEQAEMVDDGGYHPT